MNHPDPTQPYLIPVRESAVPGLGTQGRCPKCSEWAGIWPHDHPLSAGRLGTHSTAKGTYCPGSETAITYEAAAARDSLLNTEEKAARSRVLRHLNGCQGPLLDDQCHHPACGLAVRRGLQWTLMGWKLVDDLALF